MSHDYDAARMHAQLALGNLERLAFEKPEKTRLEEPAKKADQTASEVAKKAFGSVLQIMNQNDTTFLENLKSADLTTIGKHELLEIEIRLKAIIGRANKKFLGIFSPRGLIKTQGKLASALLRNMVAASFSKGSSVESPQRNHSFTVVSSTRTPTSSVSESPSASQADESRATSLESRRPSVSLTRDPPSRTESPASRHSFSTLESSSRRPSISSSSSSVSEVSLPSLSEATQTAATAVLSRRPSISDNPRVGTHVVTPLTEPETEAKVTTETAEKKVQAETAEKKAQAATTRASTKQKKPKSAAQIAAEKKATEEATVKLISLADRTVKEGGVKGQMAETFRSRAGPAFSGIWSLLTKKLALGNGCSWTRSANDPNAYVLTMPRKQNISLSGMDLVFATRVTVRFGGNGQVNLEGVDSNPGFFASKSGIKPGPITSLTLDKGEKLRFPLTISEMALPIRRLGDKI